MALGLIASAVWIVCTKWSFTGLVPDAVALALAYWAYSFFLFLIPISKRLWRGIVIAIGMIPAAAGISIGTFGLLGLIFALGDRSPHQEGTLSKNYSYRIAWWGDATSDHDGADLKILYHSAFAPFLEKEIMPRPLLTRHTASRI
jgi:hypothetical protein